MVIMVILCIVIFICILSIIILTARAATAKLVRGPQAKDRVEVLDVKTIPRHRVGQRGVIETVATSNEDFVYRIKADDGDTLLLRAGEFAVLARKEG